MLSLILSFAISASAVVSVTASLMSLKLSVIVFILLIDTFKDLEFFEKKLFKLSMNEDNFFKTEIKYKIAINI